MDLLVSYSWPCFSRARSEIAEILKRFGDSEPWINKSRVVGIAIIHTSLDSREVIRKCRELFETDTVFEFAIKWVPVDFWCKTDLKAVKRIIEEKIRDQIGETETWGMQVDKRGWQQYHTIEIIDYLAPSIERKVNLDNPDKILHIDVLGEQTAISLLRPDEIFSLGLPHL